MKIEPGTNNDLSALCDIFNRSRDANGSFPKQLYTLDEFMAVIDGEEVLVARIGEELAGFVSMWKPDNFLHHLFVLPKFQRAGVGKMLVTESIHKFGLPMSLKCIKANTQACRFYERLGFQAQEEGVGPEGPYIHYCRAKKYSFFEQTR